MDCCGREKRLEDIAKLQALMTVRFHNWDPFTNHQDCAMVIRRLEALGLGLLWAERLLGILQARHIQDSQTPRDIVFWIASASASDKAEAALEVLRHAAAALSGAEP